MIHVLPGDAQVEAFRDSGIDGELIVCRECLMVGPIDAATPEEFWNERAAFILSEYGEDEILYHETVADELEKLRDLGEGDEVNLWFEYELFCSVNLWFCLSLLADSGASVYRVHPAFRSVEDRWKGFGGASADDLTMCFEARQQFTGEELLVGAELWNAYRSRDLGQLKTLSDKGSARFPYLKEVCAAAIEMDTAPARIVAEIRAEGKAELDEVFPEFSKRAGVYGFGDLQLMRIMDRPD
jgi:hypothetical protein